MTPPLPFDGPTRRRIIAAITAHVAMVRPGHVLSVDSLYFEQVALQASRRQSSLASPAELRWIRGLVAEAMATREERARR